MLHPSHIEVRTQLHMYRYTTSMIQFHQTANVLTPTKQFFVKILASFPGRSCMIYASLDTTNDILLLLWILNFSIFLHKVHIVIL